MPLRERAFLPLLLLSAGPLLGQADRQLAHDILKELIETNTTDSSGDNTRAAEAMAARFKAAGFADADVQVLSPAARKGNLVVRLRSENSRQKPILFIGHLDVVEAKREDWSFDPFVLTEQDNYFYGRGTQDMKSDDALLVTTFIRLKRENFVPARDLILALTSDEEGGQYNGVQWLLKEHRDVIDAEYAINADAGGGEIRNGKRLLFGVQAAEKTYATFRFEARNKGGHSSLPVKDNAIYHVADVLGRLQRFEFPPRLNQVTRAFFTRMAAISSGQLAADFKGVGDTPANGEAVARLSHDPFYNALLHTTCVPTELTGGHAENALPQMAAAIVNCRILPEESPKGVEEALTRTAADPQVTITPTQPIVPSPFSPLRADVLNAIEQSGTAVWGRVPVVPLMEAGATDGKWLRIGGIPTYGVSALFLDVNDIRAHGKDERVPQEAFYEGLRFDYALVHRLGSPARSPVR